MIVSRVGDPLLMQAVRGAAHPEEDVISDAELALEALQLGFPRLLVRSGAALLESTPSGVPVLDVDEGTLRRWETKRRASELLAPKLDHYTERLRILMAPAVTQGSWVDRVLADISRAAGAPLPIAFRTFARRVLEFPSGYTSLHDVSRRVVLTRGALKARFRRRGMASPYSYLRWLRLLAVAEVLSDSTVTVARSAHRLGFTSAGNLCRVIDQLAETTTTELRTARGRRRLVVLFTSNHLTPEAIAGWATLTDLFTRRAA